MAVRLGVVFDLDDTLYLERDYVQSGFKSVASLLQDRAGIDSEQAFESLWGFFEKGVRGNSFDLLFEVYPELSGQVKIEDLVQAYRAHEPIIEPIAGVVDLVYELRGRGCRLGLLSDGPLKSQQAKLRALSLEDAFEPLVLTDAWGRNFWKPHPRGYELFAKTWGFHPQEMVYIGDNPEKDFLCPNKLGWHTIRLKIKGQLRFAEEPVSPDYAPGLEASSFADLRELLDRLIVNLVS
ncbi:MAG: HAD-IA family hydrolase [Firmicutes bacterium]|nr:HAD-IA family hydrolase [Bacillota bacterium]